MCDVCERAGLPSVIPPASEKLLGVRDLGFIRKGWEDLPGDKSRSYRQLLSGAALWMALWKDAVEFPSAVKVEWLLLD